MDFTQLCIVAHKKALAEGKMSPAERRDLGHLPMRWEHQKGTAYPVFDEERIPAHQMEATVELLEHLAGQKRIVDAFGAIRARMEALGRFGVRVDDIVDDLGISKPTALKHLRKLVDDGLVEVRETPTRGPKASPRKVYYWLENAQDRGTEELHFDGDDPTDLRIEGDRNIFRRDQRDEAGIVHHGAAVSGIACPDRCFACTSAIQEAFFGEMRTSARKSGGTGFSVGLAERIAVREASERAIFDRLQASGAVWGLSPAERESWHRDQAREMVRAGL